MNKEGLVLLNLVDFNFASISVARALMSSPIAVGSAVGFVASESLPSIFVTGRLTPSKLLSAVDNKSLRRKCYLSSFHDFYFTF
jgi:hypothetical protein